MRTDAPTDAGQGMVVDVLVVGGGQAGLATAQAMRKLGIGCVVHERHDRIGNSWRHRFDSLVLFSPRKVSALPGLSHDGDPRGYPGKDEMGDYLERFAARFDLPVTTGDGIASLRRAADQFIAITDSGRRIDARCVVIATGAFQRPRVPGYATMLPARVEQLDAQSYRNPSSINGDAVLVAGDGATGRQIALELAEHGRDVTLATGRARWYTSQRVFHADFTDLGWRAGLLTADKSSVLGRTVRALDATPSRQLRRAALRRAGIRLAPRSVAARGSSVEFADGTELRCDTVVWTTGYRDDTSWVEIDDAASASGFVEDRGVTPIRGLFHVGREWQTSRASALVCGVHLDAQRIAALAKRQLAG